MEGVMNVLYPRCAGLDVHKDTVVAAVRIAADGPANTEVRTFDTTTPGLLALSGWLAECGCTHVAMEATGVYWKPVWHILSDGDITLITAGEPSWMRWRRREHPGDARRLVRRQRSRLARPGDRGPTWPAGRAPTPAVARPSGSDRCHRGCYRGARS